MFMWLRPFPAVALCFTLAITARAQAQDDEPAPPPWSAKAVAASQAHCRANMTASGIEGPKVERYCECATDALQARFTAAEVRKMQREYDPGDKDDSRPPELDKTLDQCSPVLESQ
ncbi:MULTISPECIES: hypothetical protein [Salinicola]|uniref:Uncharacterized protein n=1 Tax=Salinicola socius TaxID=404433 RepID=A0A1Q8SRR9_9GAMM|nr:MULTISPECIES: hypothetical protein [Salinicola]OLO04135.1 hypothetical protein BTW07_10930 [Salinicola socius]